MDERAGEHFMVNCSDLKLMLIESVGEADRDQLCPVSDLSSA